MGNFKVTISMVEFVRYELNMSTVWLHLDLSCIRG
jgi:hypothetical protein